MKLQYMVRWMVLAAIVLVAAHAFAAPVNLVCKNDHYNEYNTETHRITFDENMTTAFFDDDPESIASFTATNIKWFGFLSKYAPKATFNLDRISGVLSIDVPGGSAGKYNCVVAENKF